MLVEMQRLMANPDHGTVQPGQIIDLPAAEARRRIAAGDCKPVTGTAPERLRRAAGPAEQEPVTGGQGDEVPVEKMTVDQLKTYAAAEEIDLGDATRKDDIRVLVLAELERRRDADDD
ncbi:hypothetical protein ACTFBT_16110 [Streptomyces microflavus]|uniref:hypothetical protein n=1 Tax=Streptomyces TaxID=1883 RepID=UPI0005165286|nr:MULTISPECIES: hypothetical protein [Streptomyces]MDX2981210.1 hypothetical protein [Streptomyces sp. NRRL_B-2249]